jgi:hypothetical protein
MFLSRTLMSLCISAARLPPCLCFAYSHLSAVIGSILADHTCAKTRQCQYRAFSYDQDQHHHFAVSVSQGIRPAPFDEA